jgi:hypothetical protein
VDIAQLHSGTLRNRLLFAAGIYEQQVFLPVVKKPEVLYP